MFDDVFRLVQKRKSIPGQWQKWEKIAGKNSLVRPRRLWGPADETVHAMLRLKMMLANNEATWSNMKQLFQSISIYFNLFQLIYNLFQSISIYFNLFQSISYVSECFPKNPKSLRDRNPVPSCGRGPVAQGSYYERDRPNCSLFNLRMLTYFFIFKPLSRQ
jgi:hypothetical protein